MFPKYFWYALLIGLTACVIMIFLGIRGQLNIFFSIIICFTSRLLLQKYYE